MKEGIREGVRGSEGEALNPWAPTMGFAQKP